MYLQIQSISIRIIHVKGVKNMAEKKKKSAVERISRVIAWIMLIALLASSGITLYTALNTFFSTR